MRSAALTMAAAVLLAGSLSPQAQSTGETAPGATQAGAGQEGTGEGRPQTGPGAHGAARDHESRPSTVFTGCIEQASDVFGDRDEQASGYVLTDAAPGGARGEAHAAGTATRSGGTGTTAPVTGSTADATASGAAEAGRATAPDPQAPGTAGASGQQARVRETLRLSGRRQDELRQLVGQRVEVRGRLSATDGAPGGQAGPAAVEGADAAAGPGSAAAGAETMSPRPSPGVDAGATGTAGTTGDTRDRAATTGAAPAAGAGQDEAAADVASSFDVESVRVIGGECKTPDRR